MDLKQLEIFVAVAKYQSFSKAAKELFLTQPTISAHIQNLEKELGTILVNRNNKIITLTRQGEILFEHAIYILNNCKRAIYDIKEYEGKIEGAIDIACSSIPETYVLPDFLKSFSKTTFRQNPVFPTDCRLCSLFSSFWIFAFSPALQKKATDCFLLFFQNRPKNGDFFRPCEKRRKGGFLIEKCMV